ncbi:hypothetical protein AAY473_027875, partial [Plecturocebus cupreus]
MAALLSSVPIRCRFLLLSSPTLHASAASLPRAGKLTGMENSRIYALEWKATESSGNTCRTAEIEKGLKMMALGKMNGRG